MMTHEEWLAKKQIGEWLAKEGHKTYARLFDHFQLNLTSDPDVIAYMVPQKGIICLNRDCDIDQASTFVRHEILHEFFTHHERLLRHLGLDPAEVPADIYKLSNIAGDYDISNKGYTPKDKMIIRKIILNGKKLRGLVTEDDHADWLKLSFEDMFDKLLDEMSKEEQDQSGSNGPDGQDGSDGQGNGQGNGSDKQYTQEYIDGWNKAIEDYKAGKLKL